jgi:sulfur carrier protein
VRIRVNGEDRDVTPKLSLAQLLDELNLPIEGVAVALNLHVVPRGKLGSTCLSEGDRVELVRAVGGG